MQVFFWWLSLSFLCLYCLGLWGQYLHNKEKKNMFRQRRMAKWATMSAFVSVVYLLSMTW